MDSEFNKREKNDSDRKNIIVLSIIAVATLLVVVAGATFAYLASTAASSNNSAINAVTEGDDTLFMIETGDALEISASPENFGIENGNVSDDSFLKVVLASGSEKTYKYDTYINIASNDFEYTSGMCFQKTLSGSPVAENTFASTAEECDSQDGFWATDGSNVDDKYVYKCYESTPDADSDTTKNNQAYCTIGGGLWKKEKTPELILDFYTGEEKSCVAGEGVCVNINNQKVTGSTTSEACMQANATNRWVEAVENEGVCYNWSLTSDLTEAEVTETESVGTHIGSQVSITSNGNTTTHYYYTKLTLINFEHNQIINGHKQFNGQLVIKRVED